VATPAVRYVAATGKDIGACTPASSPCKTIKYAIGQAQTGDTISVGPGEFKEGGLEVKGKALDFVGAGAGTATSYEAAHDTLIDGEAAAAPTITDSAGGSFSDLRIEGGTIDGPFQFGTLPALALDAIGSASGSVSYTLQSVVATAPSPPPAPPPPERLENEATIVLRGLAPALDTVTATELLTTDAESGLDGLGEVTLSLSRSTLSGSNPQQGVGLELFGTGAGAAIDADVAETSVVGADEGVILSGGSLMATRDRIAGTREGLNVESLESAGPSTATLRDSLVEALPTAAVENPSGVAVLALNRPGEVAHLSAVGSTIVAYGKGASAGLRVDTQSEDVATAALSNTVAWGGDPTGPATPPSDISGTGPGTTVTAASSSYTTAKTLEGAAITSPGTAGDVVGYPSFTDPAKGEYTLTPSSPLLDRGNPAEVLPGELDLAGNARIDGDCGRPSVPDIGAYEQTLGSACSPGASSMGPSSKTPTPGVTISKLSYTPPRRARRGRRAKHAKAGELRFTLNEAATVELVLKRETRGHLRKRACVAAARSKTKACKLLVEVSSIRVSGVAGANTVRIPDVKLLGRLKAGRYEILVAAVGRPSSSSTAVTFELP
jgi:hypothetical protein